jgi:hypothetical protein
LLVIIRHGKTEHNKLGLFTGWEDAPLHYDGKQEAAFAGKLMKAHGIQFDVVYTSWLSRVGVLRGADSSCPLPHLLTIAVLAGHRDGPQRHRRARLALGAASEDVAPQRTHVSDCGGSRKQGT